LNLLNYEFTARIVTVSVRPQHGDESASKAAPNFFLKSVFLGWSLLVLCGQASFAAIYTAGNQPYSVAAADVNGDGWPDLICVNYGDNTISVFTNDGSGLFGSNATYSVGSLPKSVVAVDVNGDGWVDLVCANHGGSTLSVLTNNRNGGFVLSSSPSTISTGTVGSGPEMVIAADVNRDGTMDLVTANSGDDGSLSILTNDGSGGFKLASVLSLPSGLWTFSVAAADVNGDGWVDLICPNSYNSVSNGNTLSVFTNNGSGGFALSSTPTVGINPNSVIAADVNGDGRVDLICASIGDSMADYPLSITVLTNTGSGTFVSNATYNVNLGEVAVDPYTGSSLITAADYNGDGKVDIICVDYESSHLVIYTNSGSGSFQLRSSTPASLHPWSVLTADVNGDGKLDVVYVQLYFNNLVVLTNSTVYAPPASVPPLSIKVSRDRLNVYRPSASAGWSLQQSPAQTTSNWTPSGYDGFPIADDGTNKSLIVTPVTEKAFFRLLHP
jgi:superoxide dismutase